MEIKIDTNSQAVAVLQGLCHSVGTADFYTRLLTRVINIALFDPEYLEMSDAEAMELIRGFVMLRDDIRTLASDKDIKEAMRSINEPVTRKFKGSVKFVDDFDNEEPAEVETADIVTDDDNAEEEEADDADADDEEEGGMLNETCEPDFLTLVGMDLEKAAEGIGIARRRLHEVMMHLSNAGPAKFLPLLHKIEDLLASSEYSITQKRHDLKVSEITGEFEGEAKRVAFGYAVLDTRYLVSDLIRRLRAVLSLSMGSAIDSDKFKATNAALGLAEWFEHRFKETLPDVHTYLNQIRWDDEACRPLDAKGDKKGDKSAK